MRTSVNSFIRSLPSIKTWIVMVNGENMGNVMSVEFEKAMQLAEKTYPNSSIELIRVGRRR